MNDNISFDERCYRLLERIPAGKVTTYRELARALGTNAWRAVGSAMARNRKLVATPCHRVVRSDGTVGQYALGTQRKIELLQQEGVAVRNGSLESLEEAMYRF